MCEEISILRRWQPVLDRAPCHWSTVRDKALLVKSGLSSSFDRNFLVVLLYYILVKWVRCHLDLIEVEVIETSNLATVPSRHVSGYMANCWLWLGDSYQSINQSKPTSTKKYLIVLFIFNNFRFLQHWHTFAPLHTEYFNTFRRKITS